MVFRRGFFGRILILFGVFLVTIELHSSEITSINIGRVTDVANIAESLNRTDFRVTERGESLKSLIGMLMGRRQQILAVKHRKTWMKFDFAPDIFQMIQDLTE
jgi:hypothetical protein